MRATEKEYLTVQQGLLPPGAAWPRDPEATLTGVLFGCAPEFARTHNRALDLVEEADPRTTREMIGDWERCVGLPDECTGIEASTLSARRKAVVAKLTYRGGQSRAYFQGLIELLGYNATIREYRPFVCGLGRCGDRLGGGHEVRYYWRVTIHGPRVTLFRTGVSTPPDKLGAIDYAEDLECLLTRLGPAQAQLIFAYEEA
jgi:uncharacterized protein YmfQ (DUF2313 family)